LELSEAGRPVYWQNERSGASYVLTPLSETTVRGYLICRDFELEVRFAGKRDVSKQKACRNDDGSWSLFGVNRPITPDCRFGQSGR
jgi:surface antigen